MTALIIIGIIVLIFAILLNTKIRAELKFYDGVLDFQVKYMFFTVFSIGKNKKKSDKKPDKRKKVKKDTGSKKTVPPKTSSKKSSSETAAENVTDDIASADDDDIDMTGGDEDTEKIKKNLSEKIDSVMKIIDKVKIVWEFSRKALKKMFIRIYVEGLVVDFRISDEDAYKAALDYGRICAVTYNLINVIQRLFTTKIKTVDIICDFNEKRSVYDGEVKVTVRPATIVSAAFIIIFGVLKNFKALFGDMKVNKQPEKKAATV